MKILFICVANSARSQLAEGIAKQIFGSKADIRSAGSQPTKVNPFAITALNEVGAEFRSLYSKTIDDLPREFVDQLDYLITLCAEEVCPVIISKAKKLHWPLQDPASKDGTDDEKLSRFRTTRDEIRKRMEAFSKDLR
jgi:arsenate reductase